MIDPITFVCMTTPRLNNLKRMVPKILPYVDKAVIVIGRKDQEAEDYLASFGNKIFVHYRSWDDNFAKQWQSYLQFIKDGWVLIMDDDEVPSDELLQSLREIVDKSNNGENYSIVKFRANPISEGQDMGAVNYWRENFFRYTPKLKYQGGTKTGCHQYLIGYQNGKSIQSNHVYYHIKSLREEYQNASRNYFIYGIWLHGALDGIQRKEWHEMQNIISRHYPSIKTFMELDDILIKGNIVSELKNWMKKTKKEYDGNPEYNECRAIHDYYFKYLHPEEI